MKCEHMSHLKGKRPGNLATCEDQRIVPSLCEPPVNADRWQVIPRVCSPSIRTPAHQSLPLRSADSHPLAPLLQGLPALGGFPNKTACCVALSK